MLVRGFSDLMMGIVNTIDKMGLRKRYLNKYKKDVDRFYKQMIYKNGETELTIKWQKRFKKNEGKLFTFLDHDDCPLEQQQRGARNYPLCEVQNLQRFPFY